MPATDAEADAAADLALIRDAARTAGAIAMKYFRANPLTWMKSGQSPVSEADMAVDAHLRETLTAARPAYGWLSEETADTPARRSARRTFVVDPIDGTRGFLEGNDQWCVSIAVVEQGATLAGVLDCPARGEVYTALSGRGAVRNGMPLQVRTGGRVLKIAGPKPLFRLLGPEWQARIVAAPYVPSLAYRVAMIASGALAGTFVKENAHDWDLAAAALILAEAGGAILDPSGRTPSFAGADYRHGRLVAGSGALLQAMAAAIADAEPVPKSARMD